MSTQEAEMMMLEMQDYARHYKHEFLVASKCPIRGTEIAKPVDNYTFAHNLTKPYIKAAE